MIDGKVNQLSKICPPKVNTENFQSATSDKLTEVNFKMLIM